MQLPHPQYSIHQIKLTKSPENKSIPLTTDIHNDSNTEDFNLKSSENQQQLTTNNEIPITPTLSVSENKGGEVKNNNSGTPKKRGASDGSPKRSLRQVPNIHCAA